MRKTILITLMLIPVTFIGCKRGGSLKTYYRYTPSVKGEGFKRLTHDIFGFHIDIPSDFQISITGVSYMDVAVIHQVGLNTSTLSDEWEIFEIGAIPFTDIPLEDGMALVAEGLKKTHTNIEEIEPYSRFKLNGYECLGWKMKWRSKTGLTISEWIILLEYNDEIRSIGVKTCRNDFIDRISFYSEILYTYLPIDKVTLP